MNSGCASLRNCCAVPFRENFICCSVASWCGLCHIFVVVVVVNELRGGGLLEAKGLGLDPEKK